MALRSWLAPSTVRHFPRTPAQPSRPVLLDAARGERCSFQVVVRADDPAPQQVRVQAGGPGGWSVRVRRVGYVPVRHHNTPIEPDPSDVDGLGHLPGYAPDPLFDEDALLLPSHETHAFWVTVRTGRDARPGVHPIRVFVRAQDGGERSHEVRVRVHDLSLPARRGFPVTQWFYADALIDRYRTDLFDGRFWEIAPRYMKNLAEHGADTIYVPVFTPPLDGVKRPSQLLRVSRPGRDRYRFDWRDVARYVRAARRSGIRRFEWCHPFTQWGTRHAVRIYEGQGREEKLLWAPDTGAASPTYRAFLSQFLPQLHRFLSEERILARSIFHVADEPHGDEHLANYRKARGLLRELAPWMRVMDTLTDIVYARQGLVDTPVPSIRAALDFVKEGIPSWCYYCCGPRGKYLNRLMDTPLAKIAMHGFLFYRWPLGGFLHWGYNYWYQSQTRNLIDPFSVQDGLRWPGWAYGDPFQVYPGPEGPIDSIRWEVFGESLQDYALLQARAVDRDDPMLKAIRSFAEFPKDAGWRRRARVRILALPTGKRTGRK